LKEPRSAANICKALGDHEDERVLRNKTIGVLVTRIWDLTFWKIFKYALVPYLVLFFSFLSYMLVYFSIEEGNDLEIRKVK